MPNGDAEAGHRGDPYLKLCDLEQSGQAYHYTYETLRQLNRQHPDTVFYFIMGADSLFEFDTWKEPGVISKECILLAAVRDHRRREEIQVRIEELTKRYGATIYILNTPNMDIASEDIRKAMAEGREITHLMPDAVAEYIIQNGLYRSC